MEEDCADLLSFKNNKEKKRRKVFPLQTRLPLLLLFIPSLPQLGSVVPTLSTPTPTPRLVTPDSQSVSLGRHRLLRQERVTLAPPHTYTTGAGKSRKISVHTRVLLGVPGTSRPGLSTHPYIPQGHSFVVVPSLRQRQE